MENGKKYLHYSDYFREHKNYFLERRDNKSTIIWLSVALICALITFGLWFQYDAVMSFFSGGKSSAYSAAKFGTLVQILKYGAPIVGILAAFISYKGSYEFVDKKYGGVIKFSVLDKYVPGDDENALEYFQNGQIEDLLTLPTVQTYYSNNHNKVEFGEDKIGKKYYVFFHYNGEALGPKIIGEPEYSQIKPLVEENIIQAKKLSNQ